MLKIFKYLAALAVLTVVLCILYFPALSGGFVLDDAYSLSKLSLFKGEIKFDKLKHYYGISDTGVLGRPIVIFPSLFAALNWPAEPYAFKRTNLIIHVVNGFLLYCLQLSFLKYKKDVAFKTYCICFFAMSIWACHPLFVSTVGYIVQRMAMLPLTFVILGLLVYFLARKNYLNGRINAFKWQIVVVYLCVFLAILSKENGLLMCFYVYLFEIFICQKYFGDGALAAKELYCMER